MFSCSHGLIFFAFVATLSSIECDPMLGWAQVSFRWPSTQTNYYIATARGHHFIEVKLPKSLEGGMMKIKLEYFYNYSRIRPDIQLVPCSVSLDVVHDEVLQPRGQWLVHEMSLKGEICQVNNILIYNILLHEEGDVFAWRHVKVSIDDNASLSNYTCSPSECDPKLFGWARFMALDKGLPNSLFYRLHQDLQVHINTISHVDPYTIDLKTPPESNSRVDVCFKLELYMDSNTTLELSQIGQDDTPNFLEKIDACDHTNWWFTFKRCFSDYQPEQNLSNALQLRSSRYESGQYVIIARPKEVSWLEPYIEINHLPSGGNNNVSWAFSVSGGPEVEQEVRVEFGERLLVTNIDSRAESVNLRSNWLVWSTAADEGSWFYFSFDKAGWIKDFRIGLESVELQEQIKNEHEWIETPTSELAKLQLKIKDGARYRLRVRVILREQWHIGAYQASRTKRNLTINTLAVTKDELW